MATRGRRTTATSASPSAARTPVSREVSSSPRRSTISPRPMSVPGEGDVAPGRDRPAHRAAASPSASVCSTMTTASAPRGSMRPGGDRGGRCRARRSCAAATPGVSDLGVEAQPARLLLAGAEGVLGLHGEAIDVGAVEARHVDAARRRPRPARGPGRRPSGTVSRRRAGAGRARRGSGARPRRGRSRRGTGLVAQAQHSVARGQLSRASR